MSYNQLFFANYVCYNGLRNSELTSKVARATNIYYIDFSKIFNLFLIYIDGFGFDDRGFNSFSTLMHFTESRMSAK